MSINVLKDLDPNCENIPRVDVPITKGGIDLGSPQFKGWRDRTEPRPASNVNSLKQQLIQKKLVLKGCDTRFLPDGGERLVNDIRNLTLAISEQEPVNVQKVSYLGTSKPGSDKMIPNQSNTVSNVIGPAKIVSEVTVPAITSHPTVIRVSDDKNNPALTMAHGHNQPQVTKSIIWAGPPQHNIHVQSQATNASTIVWAGPPQQPTHIQQQGVINQTSAWAKPPPHNAANNFVRPNSELNPMATTFIPGANNFAQRPHNFHHNQATGSNQYYNKQYWQKGNNYQYDNNGRQGTMQQHQASGPQHNAYTKTYSKAGQQLLPGQRYVQQTLPHSFQKFQGLWSAKSQQHQYYGGRMTKTRIEEVKSVTEDAVVKLHKSLDGCPGPETQELDPDELSSSLMPHQRQALAWLLWRERQDPPGGVLADDMGLGKTLTMLSLILKSRQVHKAKDGELSGWLSKKGLSKSKGTLVVCPASLLMQWEKEVTIHCQPDALKVLLYHGPNREKDVTKLSSYDVVITTYTVLTKELGDSKESKEDDDMSTAPTLLRIAWERVVLDEAHTIKNPKAKGCNAVCLLRATYRWALTGTPIHNNLLDMYSLLKFLRVSPFDELKVWKKWVDNKSSQGKERLSTLMKSLLLRRTKDQLDGSGKPLVRLPKRSSVMHEISLEGKDREVYDKLYSCFQSTLDNVLEMKASEDKEAKKDGSNMTQAMVFTLLLRLQQACNHLSLLVKAVADSSEPDQDDLTAQLETLSLGQEEKNENIAPNREDKLILEKYKNDKDFNSTSESCKITAFLAELKKVVDTNDKCVVVSQWTSMLNVVAVHLKNMKVPYTLIQGNIPVKNRMASVDDFNDASHETKVMLLSLKAGGVGLNLTGGNHLFLLDVHWNPALENQACDRIFRVGQTKDVVIHRFICKESVEEKILNLQARKLALAKSVLEGGEKAATGLTLADLKQLFCVK